MIRRDFVKSLILTAAGLYVLVDAGEIIVEPIVKMWFGHDFVPMDDVFGRRIISLTDRGDIMRENFNLRRHSWSSP
jgi:hypothetical protein